jgi:LPXTG-motif cell wall-anchored protein
MPPASNGSDLDAIQKEEEDNTTTYLIIGVGVLLVAGVWYAKKKGLLK